MASLSTGHFFRIKKTTIQEFSSKGNSRILTCVSCQSMRTPEDPAAAAAGLKAKNKEEEKEKIIIIRKVWFAVERLGRGFQDNLSPKQKGDWRDIMLMSVSFAVYVYMSQKIVCAYCAWVSMPKQTW